MPNRLTKIRVSEVTLCKSPAIGENGRILIMKSKSAESEPEWEKQVLFKAFDNEKQIAYGYALVPDVEDSQEDIADAEEVEKAAHSFLETLAKGLQKGQGTGHEHKEFDNIGYPVESMIDRDGLVGKSLGIPDDKIRPGGWIIGVKMEDEYWELAKSGEITGFSIGGVGKRTPIEKSEDLSLGSAILDFITKTVSNGKARIPKKLEKGTSYEDIEKAMTYKEIVTIQEVRKALIDKTYSLMNAFWSIMDDDDISDKIVKVLESVDQYTKDIGKLNKIEKNLNSNSDGDEPMEELIKSLGESIGKLTTTVEGLVEKFDDKKSEEDVEKKDKAAGDKEAETDLEKKDPQPDPEKEELKKTVETLVSKIDAMEKKLIEASPRKSDDSQDIDKTETKKLDAESDLSELTKNTPLSFRIG